MSVKKLVKGWTFYGKNNARVINAIPVTKKQPVTTRRPPLYKGK